jgi:hypothetical protein
LAKGRTGIRQVLYFGLGHFWEFDHHLPRTGRATGQLQLQDGVPEADDRQQDRVLRSFEQT